MNVLVTGSCGLIGSEAVKFYCEADHTVIGVDNNAREYYFGKQGSTKWMENVLLKNYANFKNYSIDICDLAALEILFKNNHFDLIIHCAAQPSHDKAADFPLVDFSVNASGTLNLLELTRLYCSAAVFIYMSTNKVYGDAPNEIEFIETATRYDIPFDGSFDESTRIDQSTHSIFGVGKLAGDLMTQEYGRYFGIKTGTFRGGCLTGPAHSGVQLHGFLSYLIKCAMLNQKYTIFGYKGKQVRDNIHSKDVCLAFEEFRKNPRPGEVYNLGGGRSNSISMLEAISKIHNMTGKLLDYKIEDIPRRGDHKCYISDLSKFKSHYPNWDVTVSLDDIFKEIIDVSI